VFAVAPLVIALHNIDTVRVDDRITVPAA